MTPQKSIASMLSSHSAWYILEYLTILGWSQIQRVNLHNIIQH